MSIKLIPLNIGHNQFVFKLLSNPLVDKFNTLGIHHDFSETEDYILELLDNDLSDNEKTFIISEKGNEIGMISIQFSNPKYNSASIWYKLHPDFWNKGYATRAVSLLVKRGFEIYNLHRIEAGCAIDNIGSQRVLEKCGFKKEGRKEKVLPLKSGWSDAFMYAILRATFLANQ